MSRILALLWLACCLAASAQTKLTVEQLADFVRSSIQLRHQDKKIAEFLRAVTLTNRLDERTIVEIQAGGAGPKTVEALEALKAASANLPEAKPPAPKPAPPIIPPPSAAEQQRVLNELREYARNYTKLLPDFICTQVTRRYADPTGLEFWQRQDVVSARLSYFEQKEEYKTVLVNGVMTDRSIHDLGGATSTGEFGSMMKEIFDPQTQARFLWERWATLRGKRAHVFSYLVSQPRSKWSIDYQRKIQITPAYRGLIYVDANTLMVMRLTLDAVDMPSSFPVQQASTMLDYDNNTIGEREYMLPLKAVVRMREGKFLVKNEVEFRMYRKFAAEATITFETPDPIPEEKLTEQPPKP
jgi:hypothetical protein